MEVTIMIRKIIEINQEKCNGCGLCVQACHEGAIGMVNGKAELLRDDYCDGLGDCLPACPADAITFVEREAAPYNEAAVLAKKAAQNSPVPSGCPGAQAKKLIHNETTSQKQTSQAPSTHLNQWPVQIKLAPVCAPYFDNANLLIAADCAAYAYGDFHNQYMKGKITLIGCPKLDEGDYTEKLTEIICQNNIKSVTVARMEVPCCGGIEMAVKNTLQASGKFLPWQVVTISTDGKILD